MSLSPAAISQCMLLVVMLLAALAGQAHAHSVPGITVEVETSDTGTTLLVNLDPRLVLSSTPTAMPPLTPAWWTDQGEGDQAEFLQKTERFLGSHLTLTTGAERMEPHWEFIPVDGATLTPLTESSGEVHLVARHLADVRAVPAQGAFSVAVGQTCPVPVVLLHTGAGGASPRQPQLILPGETSREVSLGAGSTGSIPPSTNPLSQHCATPLYLAHLHNLMAHGLFALGLVWLTQHQWWRPMFLLLLFHVCTALATWPGLAAWAPWYRLEGETGCWVVLGAALAVMYVVRWIPGLPEVVCILAGWWHGWRPPGEVGEFIPAVRLRLEADAFIVSAAAAIFSGYLLSIPAWARLLKKGSREG